MHEINFCCLHCGQGIELEEPFPSETFCSRCSKKIPLHLEHLHPLTQCAVCQGSAFYVQKDFNRPLGLAFVGMAAILSSVLFIADFSPFWFFLPLLIAPIVDGLLFQICPLILICYACEGIYRAWEIPQEIEGFDLARSSQLKIRRPSSVRP